MSKVRVVPAAIGGAQSDGKSDVPLLRVEIARKQFLHDGRFTEILRDFYFAVPEGSISCLYGRSGSGKSTALRIIAGLDTNYDGEVWLSEQRLHSTTPQVGMVVQTPVAYEWLSVADNLTFGLRYLERVQAPSSRSVGTRAAQADAMAALVGLSPRDLQKRPRQLSGGMRQRLALGRALLMQPKLLLLDEPFSSLDYEARQALQDLVLKIRRELGTTILCVSHDPDELLYLADKIFVVDGTPAGIVTEYCPSLANREHSSVKYSAEFQTAKRELLGFFSPVRGNNHSPG
jgi:ABC-type nitrate/sulfonate/bicarbonate transport system ATPase subunit